MTTRTGPCNRMTTLRASLHVEADRPVRTSCSLGGGVCARALTARKQISAISRMATPRNPTHRLLPRTPDRAEQGGHYRGEDGGVNERWVLRIVRSTEFAAEVVIFSWQRSSGSLSGCKSIFRRATPCGRR